LTNKGVYIKHKKTPLHGPAFVFMSTNMQIALVIILWVCDVLWCLKSQSRS